MKSIDDYSRIGALEAHALRSVLDSLLESPDIAASMNKVMESGSKADSTAIEKYASVLLTKAGAQRIVSARNARNMKILAPENGRLAKIACASPLTDSLSATVLSVECALNRIICIADAVSDGKFEDESLREETRRSISILGGGYLRTDAGWRSSRVLLPKIDSSRGITPDYYNEIDWRSTDSVASNARAVFQRSMRPNTYSTSFGVSVANQSDWDVRTRLAQILDSLELPHRYSFRFDYDVDTRTVQAIFTCPPTSFLPAFSETGTSAVKIASAHAYEAYILRLATLFTAGCFGSGKDIRNAIVVGYNSSWSRPLVAVSFTRDDFVKSALMAVDSGDLAHPSLRFDPHAVEALLKTQHIDYIGRSGSEGLREVALPEVDVSALRKEPWADGRRLSREARGLFHCTYVRDVDTAHYLGGHEEEVDIARDDAEESSLAAILRLESLVEEMEAELSPPDDDASARPLYASNAFSRLALCLIADDLDVSRQAECYLRENSPHANEESGENGAHQQRFNSETQSFQAGGESERFQASHRVPLSYFRAPDALFHAHFGLADLYQRIGDYPAAIQQADRCIALAPTTASAYYRKADILTEQGYLSQAANVIIDGLRSSVTPADSAFLYYHLGVLLWNIGRKHEAALIHVYNSSLLGEYAEKSANIVSGMKAQGDSPEAVDHNAYEALRELTRLRLPVAPVRMRDELAQATIALANTGSPLAAAPYARELERHCRKDDVLIAACQSLINGVRIS